MEGKGGMEEEFGIHKPKKIVERRPPKFCIKSKRGDRQRRKTLCLFRITRVQAIKNKTIEY